VIAEAVDTAVTLGWALAAWIAVGAFVAAVVLLGGTAVGAWAVRGLWRTVWRARPRARLCAPAGAPQGPSQDSRVPATAPELSRRRSEPHTPQWARKDAA
jgi:hypothetical protein